MNLNKYHSVKRYDIREAVHWFKLKYLTLQILFQDVSMLSLLVNFCDSYIYFLFGGLKLHIQKSV